MKNNEIYMIYGTEYKEMTKKLLKDAELIERIPDKNCRIGIKPNLVSPSDASYGATTHPEVVAGIIEYLQDNGCTQLVILEGSWVGSNTRDVISLCGYDSLAKKYQAELIDTQKDTHCSKDCAGMKLDICSSALDIDFLINVPVMKGHCQTKITCALKNMKGLITNKEKRHFHTMGLHKPIAHLNTAIHQDFIVIDSICGDWDFEDGGNPVVLNRVMAAADPVLCDAFVAREMSYTTEDVPYIGMAQKLGVGTADLSKLELHYCNQADEQIELPKISKAVEVCDAVEEVESCSACYGYLIPVLDRLRKEGLLEHLREKIAIGQGYKGQTGPLGIGSCTSGFTCSLKGCPPMPEEMYHFLKTHIEEHKGDRTV